MLSEGVETLYRVNCGFNLPIPFLAPFLSLFLSSLSPGIGVVIAVPPFILFMFIFAGDGEEG